MRLKIICSQASHIQKCLDLRHGVLLQRSLSIDNLQTVEEQAIHSVFKQHPELYDSKYDKYKIGMLLLKT